MQQDTAAHCNALQHTAAHTGSSQGNTRPLLLHTLQLTASQRNNTLHRTATHCNTLHHAQGAAKPILDRCSFTHCNSLHHNAATHCTALQCTATHCITHREQPSQYWTAARSLTATHCITTQQHAAPHCNALQHTASRTGSSQGNTGPLLFFADARWQNYTPLRCVCCCSVLQCCCSLLLQGVAVSCFV